MKGGAAGESSEGPTLLLRVSSVDKYPDQAYTLPSGSLASVLYKSYADARLVPPSSVCLTLAHNGQVLKDDDPLVFDASAFSLKGREKAVAVSAVVYGLPALRSLFDLYDGQFRGPRPNERTGQFDPTVKKIVFGTNLVIEPWFSSPFPRYIAPFLKKNGGVLYVCDVCLRYCPVKEWMEAHAREEGGCARGVGPPGRLLFRSRDGALCAWEVDGGLPAAAVAGAAGLPTSYAQDLASLRSLTAGELFAQHAGLLGRMFLKGKVSFYQTGSFVYVALTEFVKGAHRFRGYYSVAKMRTGHVNSLSCIMVLPPWQDRGFGRLLIHLSYIFSRPTDGSLSDKTPERPLSDLGMTAFLSYWKGAVLDTLCGLLDSGDPVCGTRGAVDRIVAETGVRRSDVMKALHILGLLAKPGSVASDLDWDAVERCARRVQRAELELADGGWNEPPADRNARLLALGTLPERGGGGGGGEAAESDTSDDLDGVPGSKRLKRR